VAQALVAHGLPALVANQYSVLDSSATSFAQHFYWALAQGMSVGRASSEARIRVNYSMQGELIDWAVPVVYARDPCMTLCTPPAVKRDLPTRSATVALERKPHERRVAVLDIDSVFPDLASTLARMDAAQSAFGFTLESFSAPLDAWDTSEKSVDGTPYLHAEKLAQRLAHMPAELGVDVLACITRHWMRDNDTLNIYGWWPDDGKPPVMLFSCAGLEDLPVEGPATDRAIANLMVSGLTGILAKVDTHAKGEQDCPLWTNEERSVEAITGRQRFDRTCRAKLTRAIPDELPALDTLLNLFH
jgi:hypothetical protein